MVAEKLEAKDEILLNYPKEVSLALLILFGTLGVEAPQKVGWILLFLAVGARAIVWIAEALLRPPAPQPLPLSTTRAPAEGAAPEAEPVATGPPLVVTVKRYKLGRLVTFTAYGLGVVGIGLVIGGLLNDAVQMADWIVLAVAIVALGVGTGIKGELPALRSVLAKVLAVVIVLVVAAAVVEIVGHGHDDLDKLVSYLPGDQDSGLEERVRDVGNWFVDNVWNRLWPW